MRLLFLRAAHAAGDLLPKGGRILAKHFLRARMSGGTAQGGSARHAGSRSKGGGQLALGDLSFDAAVLKHSTREATRNQKGQVVNVRDGGTRFGVDELDPNVFFLLQDLDPGEVSAPVQLLDEDNQAYWALIRLDERFPAHRANPRFALGECMP